MQADHSKTNTQQANPPAARTFAGGVLMGLANLVPGVSGGTMILALGLYDAFIGAVADLTSLRWSKRLFVFLTILGVGLVIALLGFSGPAVELVRTKRWIMYSLFIGMALGGVPQLARHSRPMSLGSWLAAAIGLGIMVLLALRLQDSRVEPTYLALTAIGALAASSMILPGISGSYLLLIFGLYDTVIGSLSVSELRADPAACARILGPVIVGAFLGIALLSNLLKFVLQRYSKVTHAWLLGLLLGSVIGLWPFQENTHPELADRPIRKAVTSLIAGENMESVRAEYEVDLTDAELTDLVGRYSGFTAGDLKFKSQETEMIWNPSMTRVLMALGWLILGFLITLMLGGSSKASKSA